MSGIMPCQRSTAHLGGHLIDHPVVLGHLHAAGAEALPLGRGGQGVVEGVLVAVRSELADAVRDMGGVQPVLQLVAVLLADTVHIDHAAHGAVGKRHGEAPFI